MTLERFYEQIGFDPSTTPESVRKFPSMMAEGEKVLLYGLARHWYRGTGRIIDAGLFLGASTHAFGTGLKANLAVSSSDARGSRKIIHAYETAIWHSAGFDKYLESANVLSLLGEHRYSDGESYFPLLLAVLSDHLDLIEFHIGDIVQEIGGDGPVEIAFFDCLKNYERDWAVFKALAPHYVPGRTVIVQQDYFFEDALENKIRQEFLAPYFTFCGAVATSAVFLLKSPIPPEFTVVDPVVGIPVDTKVDLLETASSRIPFSPFALYTEMAVVNFLVREHRFTEAGARLAIVEDKIRSASSLPARPAAVAEQLRRSIPS